MKPKVDAKRALNFHGYIYTNQIISGSSKDLNHDLLDKFNQNYIQDRTHDGGAQSFMGVCHSDSNLEVALEGSPSLRGGEITRRRWHHAPMSLILVTVVETTSHEHRSCVFEEQGNRNKTVRTVYQEVTYLIYLIMFLNHHLSTLMMNPVMSNVPGIRRSRR